MWLKIYSVTVKLILPHGLLKNVINFIWNDFWIIIICILIILRIFFACFILIQSHQQTMLPLRIHPKLLKWNQNFVTGGVLFYFVLLSRYLSTQNDPVMTRTSKIRLKCIFKSSAHLFFSNFIMSACFVICSKNQIFLCKKRLTDLQHFKMMCPVNLVVGMFRLPVVLEEWNPLFSFFLL